MVKRQCVCENWESRYNLTKSGMSETKEEPQGNSQQRGAIHMSPDPCSVCLWQDFLFGFITGFESLCWPFISRPDVWDFTPRHALLHRSEIMLFERWGLRCDDDDRTGKTGLAILETTVSRRVVLFEQDGIGVSGRYYRP